MKYLFGSMIIKGINFYEGILDLSADIALGIYKILIDPNCWVFLIEEDTCFLKLLLVASYPCQLSVPMLACPLAPLHLRRCSAMMMGAAGSLGTGSGPPTVA